MSNPEYIVFTDSELEHVRRSYFEQKRLGTEHSVALSKELLCRLIRNTMTNMISIARATEDSRYPSKHEVNAMAKRLVEYYPMIKDRSSSSNTEWVLDELRRIIQPTNSQYISEMKDRWEIFYSKVQFYGIMKKAMKPPKTLNGVEHAAAVFRALPLLFPSSTMPPRKLGANSEALFHVLTVKHSWIEGPRHILFQLDCLKSQRKDVLDLVMPTVRRCAWYAHSEAILQTLLCSEDQKEMIERVERILAIRGEGDPDTQLGDSSVRTRRTPDINCDASSIGDLISRSEGVSEPPLTCFLSTLEVKNFINTPMEVLNWPCHTQSIERVELSTSHRKRGMEGSRLRRPAGG
ncbi:hypothetical protein AAFF_G00044910 [Aldrovandia affinis]|uniref:Uncharacterized protein n=1 Tax=Aldrovandia affinis TaxID=143900 RepID=A0AAD7WEU2_9TELE|nr:hypothetical protein AAFF_G00044910 [Aldrovandia affinis]